MSSKKKTLLFNGANTPWKQHDKVSLGGRGGIRTTIINCTAKSRKNSFFPLSFFLLVCVDLCKAKQEFLTCSGAVE